MIYIRFDHANSPLSYSNKIRGKAPEPDEYVGPFIDSGDAWDFRWKHLGQADWIDVIALDTEPPEELVVTPELMMLYLARRD